MTSIAREQFVQAATAPRVAGAESVRRDRAIWLSSTAIVALLFAALLNRYWVPGGDSELYVAIARNLLRGNGYMFNGRATRIAPPGWPWVLAFVIKFVSPTFVVLKLVTLACMTAALAVYYRVIRRFAAPLLSAGIVLLTAILSHVYPLTFWLHSDALFVLLSALCILLALQISEGRREGWRIALLVVLCIAAEFVRWAGLVNMLIVAAALLHGQWKPRIDRIWLTAAAVIVVTATTWVCIRIGLIHFAPPTVLPEDTALIDPSAQLTDTAFGEITGQEVPLITPTGRGNTGYVTRFLGFGTWISYLLWQPLRMAAGFHFIWWIATACGWIVLCIMLVACADELRARRWLLPVMFVCMLGLDLNWPQANARYLVPMSPLILLCIARGIAILQTRATRPWQRLTWRTIGIIGFGCIVLCNAALYAVDVSVMRSPRFADRYEAGVDKSLIAIGKYLSEHRVGNWQTCINPEYININKRRMNPTGLRKLTMLTGKAMLQLPRKFTDNQYKLPRDHIFRDWISRYKVRYYIEQPTISPWRLWHFRTAWLQELLTGQPVEHIDARWVLYRCDGRSVPIEVAVPELDHYPTRVPGF